GAVTGEDLGGHAEEGFLGGVRVDDEASLDVGGAPRDLGETMTDQPAGTRLGEGDRQAMGPEEPPDHRLQVLVLLGVPGQTEGSPQRGLERAEGLVGAEHGGAGDPEPHADLVPVVDDLAVPALLLPVRGGEPGRRLGLVYAPD